MGHILVVDDMAVFRKPIAQALEAAGHSTATAADGLEALDRIDRQRPDLIVCDMAMPNMDGRTLVQTLKRFATLRDIPVIVLTALADREVVLGLLKLGVRDYILKSNLHLGELVAKVGASIAGDAPPTTASVHRRFPSSSEIPSLRRIKVLGVDRSQLQSLHTVMTEDEVIAACRAERGVIEQFSPTVALLIRLLSDPDVSVEQLVAAIRADHHLALKVVRIANSAAFGRGGHVVSGLKDAVIRIGIGKIGEALRSLGVVDYFLEQDPLAMLDAGMFWEHCVAVGLLASELAQLLKLPDPEDFFTAGILHDIGKLILLHREWSRYGYVYDRSDHLRVPVDVIERHTMPQDHGAAVGSLLREWGYGDRIAELVGNHHMDLAELGTHPATEAREIAVLRLANHLAHAMLIGFSNNEFIHPLHPWYAFLGLEPTATDPILARVTDQALDIKLALLSHLHARDWDQYDQVLRDRLDAPVRAHVISLSGDSDPFALVCRRLWPVGVNAPPNCAVLHVEDPSRLDDQLAQLLDLEATHALPPLPTIMLTSEDRLAVPERVLDGRTTLVNRTPIATEMLLQLFSIARKRHRAGSHG